MQAASTCRAYPRSTAGQTGTRDACEPATFMLLNVPLRRLPMIFLDSGLYSAALRGMVEVGEQMRAGWMCRQEHKSEV